MLNAMAASIAMLLYPWNSITIRLMHGIRAGLQDLGQPWQWQVVPKEGVAQAIAQRPDGWIIGPGISEHHSIEHPHQVHISEHLGSDDDRPQAAGAIDQPELGGLAADHLWQRGYRRAACLDVATSDEVRERLVGFQLRCEQLGMPCHWIDRPADDAPVDRSELLRQVLASDSRPCGIYCHHDRTAAFCRDDVLAWGWSIPDRVGIIGTGDIPAVCFSQAPELSSVPLPWYAMGRQAVLQLQRQLNGSAIKDLPLLRPAVVECRASTALAEQPDRLASKALTLVRRHLHRSWSVEELADRLGCSPPTLRRHILRSTGMGLHAWRQRERIDRAKSLLMRGDLSLQQVAERCGFTSRRSFHRVFREQAGLAPGAYRTEQGM